MYIISKEYYAAIKNDYYEDNVVTQKKFTNPMVSEKTNYKTVNIL